MGDIGPVKERKALCRGWKGVTGERLPSARHQEEESVRLYLHIGDACQFGLPISSSALFERHSRWPHRILRRAAYEAWHSVPYLAAPNQHITSTGTPAPARAYSRGTRGISHGGDVRAIGSGQSARGNLLAFQTAFGWISDRFHQTHRNLKSSARRQVIHRKLTYNGS